MGPVQIIQEKINIQAPPEKVWEFLTNPRHMEKWISEEEIEVQADWRVGGEVTITGDIHFGYFKNNGKVLAVEPFKFLSYSERSSLSCLPDEAASYYILEFRLKPLGPVTELKLTIKNFPTHTIYKHLAFYWPVTLEIFRNFIERAEPLFFKP